MLLDGVRVNDPTNARGGSFDFSALDIADVERVEIARGPYSAVYGGDALAGVINIVTRHEPAEKGYASADVMGGTYDTHEIALNTGGPVAAGDGTWVSATATKASRSAATNSTRSGSPARSISSSAAQRTPSVSGRYAETSRAGFPDAAAAMNSRRFATSKNVRRKKRCSEPVSRIAPRRHVRADVLEGFHRDDHIDSPASRPASVILSVCRLSVVDSSLNRFTATLTGTQKFSDFVSLAYGAEWQREEGVSNGSLDFGGGFVLPTSVPAHANLVGAFRRSATGHELWPVDAGGRARGQSRTT